MPELERLLRLSDIFGKWRKRRTSRHEQPRALSPDELERVERSAAFVDAHPLDPLQRFLRICALYDELPPDLRDEFLRRMARPEDDHGDAR